MGSLCGRRRGLVHFVGRLMQPPSRRENPVVEGLQLTRHLVEGAGQNSDFVLLADAAAAGEISGRNPSGSLLDAAERPQQPSGDEVESHDREERRGESDREEGPGQGPRRAVGGQGKGLEPHAAIQNSHHAAIRTHDRLVPGPAILTRHLGSPAVGHSRAKHGSRSDRTTGDRTAGRHDGEVGATQHTHAVGPGHSRHQAQGPAIRRIAHGRIGRGQRPDTLCNRQLHSGQAVQLQQHALDIGISQNRHLALIEVGAQPFAGSPGVDPTVAVEQLDQGLNPGRVHQAPGSGKSLVEHGARQGKVPVQLGAGLLQLQRQHASVRCPPGEEACQQQSRSHHRARGRGYLGGDVPPIHSSVTSPTKCRSAGECRLRRPGPSARR